MSYTKTDLLDLSGDAEIELWQVDLTIWGGPVKYYHNCLNQLTDKELDYGGDAYEAVPIEGSGFDFDGNGPPPQPIVSISNIGFQIMDLAKLYRRFMVCPVTKVVTLRKHLDDGSDPDSSNWVSKDVFVVDHIIAMDDRVAEIQLATNIDAFRAQMPYKVVRADEFPGTAFAGHV